MARQPTKENEKIYELFFDNAAHRFEAFSEKQIPNTIQLWLSRFYISKKDFAPVIQVNEKENGGFEVEVLVKNNAASMQPVETLSSFMKQDGDRHFAVLKDLQLLANYMPELNKTIASNGKAKLQYNSQTFAEVLTAILPAIRLFGIQTLLPKSLQQLLKPQVTVALTSKTRNTQYFSLNELLDYDWKIAMGDSFIGKEEFLALAKQSAGLVKIRDRYILMSQEEIEKVIRSGAAVDTQGIYFISGGIKR